MAVEKKKIDFTQGKIFFKLIWFVLPIVATNLLQMLYNAADMMVVSLSPEKNAVGAIGTTSSFIHLIVNLFIGFSVGVNVVVSHYIGAKNREKTQSVVHTAVILAIITGVAGGVVGVAISRPVLVAMGNTGSLLDLAVTYTCIYFAGVPFLALTNYLVAIFRAKGDSKTPLTVLSVAGVINVLLNLFFVLVLRFSVEGVALATVISNVFSFGVLLWKLCKSKDDTSVSFRGLRVDKSAIKEIVRVGLPAGIQSALFSLSNMLIQSSIVKVNNLLAPTDIDYQPITNGNAAAANIEGFVYTAMNAVSQGVITFTSQNMGAKKPRRVKPVLYNGILLAILIGVVMSGIVLSLKTPLLALYGIVEGAEGSIESLAMQAATTRIIYIVVPYFLCGLMEVTTGVLRGLGKSLVATFISLVGVCLLRIVWMFMVFPLFMNLETIFLCYPITWGLSAIVGFIMIQLIMRTKIREEKYIEQTKIG